MAIEFGLTVIVSMDGRQPIALVEFEGVDRIANRDAVGFYFTVRAPSFGEDSRLAVLFSGTSLMSKPDYFGLPDYQDRDANFVQFALAAVGDHLDEVGLPPLTPSGVSAAHIEAFSGRFQEWKRRRAASDETVLTYMKSRLYWSWKYNVPRALFTSHDLLRLGIEVADLHRLAILEEGRLWSTHSKSSYGISLDPKPDLLRSIKAKVEPPPKEEPIGQDQSKAAEPVTPAHTQPSSEAAKKKRATSNKRRKGKGRDATALVFVDDARLSDLRQITSLNFDLRRVIAICEELNICYRSQCYFAVAALTRTLLDHVPPIFGVDTFAKVANNYNGGRSFKGSMQHLESSARHIADGHLHGQIRSKESLPSRTQVNFAADVDVLLAEIVRILS